MHRLFTFIHCLSTGFDWGIVVDGQGFGAFIMVIHSKYFYYFIFI